MINVFNLDMSFCVRLTNTKNKSKEKTAKTRHMKHAKVRKLNVCHLSYCLFVLNRYDRFRGLLFDGRGRIRGFNCQQSFVVQLARHSLQSSALRDVNNARELANVLVMIGLILVLRFHLELAVLRANAHVFRLEPAHVEAPVELLRAVALVDDSRLDGVSLEHRVNVSAARRKMVAPVTLESVELAFETAHIALHVAHRTIDRREEAARSMAAAQQPRIIPVEDVDESH